MIHRKVLFLAVRIIERIVHDEWGVFLWSCYRLPEAATITTRASLFPVK
jgi:hypothetical protein